MKKAQNKIKSKGDARRKLASVSALLEDPQIQTLIEEHSRKVVLDSLHQALDWYRRRLKGDTPALRNPAYFF